MTEEHAQFVLSCRDAGSPAPVLTGVHAHGRLDAVLFEMTLRQTYRNTSDQVLEVVYTFPLPSQAVLLGFSSELNGARQEGVIVAKLEAERQYETALEGGDAPVMLEALGDGLHTANIGNLKPGDEIVLECRFAQLLSFEQGRLRMSIPTTIAPRYGRAEKGGLQPQQAPVASLEADYPLTLALTLSEAFATATIECPTHRFATSRIDEGATRLDLAPGTRLDRDVVVVVTPSEPHPSLLVRATDAADASAPMVVMAALQPLPSAPRESISIKLLIDCSGSMGGDSIQSAKSALRGIVAGLSERDQLSLSRFGSNVEHLLAPSQAAPQALRQLRLLINGIQADMGGTEMEGALASVFELPHGPDHTQSDVLLVTDGNIWRSEELVAVARKSGQRVFAIGVGASPAEGVLRALAESTGGACEFVTPGEALEAAAQRMLHRMRQPVFTNVRVDWSAVPHWEAAPACALFSGDTVMAFAGFAQFSPASRIRLLADDANGRTVELARTEADAPCPGDSLPRMAAAHRMARSADGDSTGLAVQYQLMSKSTNCILVHIRAEADKATQQAELHRVSSMIAAGWGGLGAMQAPTACRTFDSPVMFSLRTSLRSSYDLRLSADHSASAAASMGATASESSVSPSLEDIAQAMGSYLMQGGQLQELPFLGSALNLHVDVQRALKDAALAGLPDETVWVLLVHWVNTRSGGLKDADLASALQPLLMAVPPMEFQVATDIFERLLGGYSNGTWALARSQRLRRLLAQMKG